MPHTRYRCVKGREDHPLGPILSLSKPTAARGGPPPSAERRRQRSAGVDWPVDPSPRPPSGTARQQAGFRLRTHP
jgi:hypothetical protein